MVAVCYYAMPHIVWRDWVSEARPAVDALLAGHVSDFFALAPAYGGSLILRAPFMLAAGLGHGGNLTVYVAGALPCLGTAAVLATWLDSELRRRRVAVLARTVATLICVANPLTISALELGHPEEILGAVLCVAAVVCALRDRPVWAGILLGLAIANKEWGILAAGPVLVALPRWRVRALIIACGAAGALMAPLLLARSGGVAGQVDAAALPTGFIFHPWQLWWFLGSVHRDGIRLPPAWISTIAHPLIVAIMVPLTALFAWVRRTRVSPRPTDPLLLLVLLLLLRCVLDPWDIAYYALPALLSLLAWEVLTYPRAPVLALCGLLGAWVTFEFTAGPAVDLSLDAQALVFTAAATAALVALVLNLYVFGAGRSRRAGLDIVPERAQSVSV